MCSKQSRRFKLSIFNMITGINESKRFPKHISCECKYKLDGRTCNSNQNWNNDKCWCECKNLKEHHIYEKDYIWNLATCSCKNGKYLTSIIDDSVITCDEIIEAVAKSYYKTTKTVPIKTVSTKSTTTNFFDFLIYLLITIALLIVVSIYCYLIKYRGKRKTFIKFKVF